MNASYPLKNLPAPLQGFIRPMLFASLALHGLLVLIPIPDEKKAESALEKEKEKSVKVTQLAPPPSRQQVAAKPSPQASKPAIPKAAPKVTPITRRVVQPATRPQPIIQTPQSRTAPAPPPPQQATSAPSPSPTSPAPETSPAPIPDFPHYPGAKAGCLEVPVSCFNTGNDFSKVTAHFDKGLPDTGYQEVPPEVDESGIRKVYKLSKSGSEFDNQYLSVISTKDGAIYVLAPEPRSLDQLKVAVTIPTEFSNIDLQLTDTQSAYDETFFDDTNVNQFISEKSGLDAEGNGTPAKFRSGIKDIPKLVKEQSPEQVYTTLENQLKQDFEQVTPVENYAGGLMYKLTKGRFTGYVNLVTDKDKTGTIVVLWTESPL